jgi:hypothetical protein
MTAARLVSCSQATSGQTLNGANLYLHSTHARPPITNSAIAMFTSRNADLSTSGSYSLRVLAGWLLSASACRWRLNTELATRVHQADGSCQHHLHIAPQTAFCWVTGFADVLQQGADWYGRPFSFGDRVSSYNFVSIWCAVTKLYLLEVMLWNSCKVQASEMASSKSIK